MNLTTIPNRLDNTTFNETNYTTTAPLAQRSQCPLKALQRLLLLVALLFATTTAWGQSVIMNGDYFLTHNEAGTNVNATATTTFNPTTCLWYVDNQYIQTANSAGEAFAGNSYLQRTSLLIGGASRWSQASDNNAVYYYTGGYYGGTYYILRLNGSTWEITSTNSDYGIPYAVDINEINQGLTDFEITGGVSSFNAAGSSTYGHTNAEYYDQDYTHYSFNGNNYYVNSSNVSTTTDPVTAITDASYYSWSLSDNADGYATVNSSTGEVTVTNIPTSGNLTITLTCTASYNGQTATATKSITLTQTGVSGGIVTLDDREDHNWTYYSGVPSSVDGGNYNTNYVGKLYSPDPRNVKITYKANGGAVSIDESETQFIYYKTIEKIDGAYKYTVISNPFSKRPDGKGFGGWRIKEGANYISGYNDEAILPLDQELTLTNLNTNYTTNCISAEIELEATWVDLNNIVRRTETGNYTYSATGGTYETNILVLQRSQTGTVTVSSPCTIMMVEPDGSVDYRNAYTFSGLISFNHNGVTKIEYSHWTPGNAINARGHSFTIGRGMIMDGTRRAVTASSNTGDNVNQIFKIESGNFNTFTHYTQNPSSITKQWIYFGNDYDRANEDNSKLTFSGLFMVGQDRNLGLSSTDEMCRVYSISGSFMTGIGIEDGAAAYSYYLCIKNNHNNGFRYFEVQGGEWYANIAGGMGRYHTASTQAFSFRMKGGTIRGSIYGAGAFAPAGGERKYIITGGKIGGWVAAGCNGIGNNTSQTNNGTTNGDSYVYVGGTATIGYQNRNINNVEGGNVFGAGRGAPIETYNVGTINNSNIVVADNAKIEKDVYGGGNYGFSLGEANIYVTGGDVEGRVFGGANMTKGYSPTIYMNGGIVEDGVYGGCNTQGIINNDVTIDILGGQVGTSSDNASVYGGGLGTATRVRGTVNVNVGSRSTCTTEGSAVIYGDVYGGSAQGITNCNDAGTARYGTSVTNVTFNAGTINGSLYGGGHGIGGAAANVWGPVAVKVYGGTLTGGVYGANNVNGAPQNSVTVDIYGTDAKPSETGKYAIANVYGGGNQAAYNNANYPTVTIHNPTSGQMSIGNVYGGGNAAAVTNTNVTVYSGNTIGAVYAGGNGTGVAATFQMVTGNAVAKIHGGDIKRVFAGNNSSGIVNGSKTVTINAGVNEAADADNCVSGSHRPMTIGAVFHGGNQANGSAGTVNIVCTGTSTAEYIDTLFGGANNADIVNNNMSTANDVTLNIDRGHIRTGIFGGNNSGGKVTGNITINLTHNSGGTCTFPYPSVFGGGFGAATETGGNIEVNIGQKTTTATAPTVNATIAGGSVYGGSALGSVNDAAGETTKVNVYNGTISGNIYGGGLGEAGNATKGMVNGIVTVNIGASDQTDANCASDLTACSVYGCNNTGGSPQRDVTVNVYRTGHIPTNEASYTSDDRTYAIDQVFGGGNAADYTPAGSNTATVHVYYCNNTVRRLFAGGNAAAARGVATYIDGGRYEYIFGGGNGEVTAANIGAGGTNLNVSAGLIDHLFGGSNTNGTISGPMITNVTNSHACGEHIKEFFGGGNLAVLGSVGSPVSLNTTINCETIFDDIYGGSNLADIFGDVTLTVNGGTIANVWAGSKGVAAGDATYPAGKAANINGNVKLNIYGGDIERAYGGSNVNGNITGTIGVDLDWSQSTCSEKEIDYIYGASNQAAYTPTNTSAVSPTVKLINGTVGVNVYGGGRGASAAVTSNPKVIAGDATTPANTATVTGDVFGGGDAAPVVGNTSVIVTHTTTSVGGNVFGGGNAAGITGNTSVDMNAGTVTTALYGGCNSSGTVTQGSTVLMSGGTTGTVYGGGYGAATTVDKGSASYGATVNLSGSATVTGNVFGGGNAGQVNGGTHVTVE
jgi:hypothetical protein